MLARLDKYQQRRIKKLAAQGVNEVGIDDHGNVHALAPSGRHVTVRRQGRRWPHAYYGISLGLWITALTDHSHRGVLGWSLLGGAQLLGHEIWPRKFRRHRMSMGDHAVEKIDRVL